MATVEQSAEILGLVNVVKLPEETTAKWFAKAKADGWNDFTQEDLGKCIAHVKSMIPQGAV